MLPILGSATSNVICCIEFSFVLEILVDTNFYYDTNQFVHDDSRPVLHLLSLVFSLMIWGVPLSRVFPWSSFRPRLF
jgi:predicted membrane protein